MGQEHQKLSNWEVSHCESKHCRSNSRLLRSSIKKRRDCFERQENQKFA